VPHGIDLSEFSDLPGKEKLRQRYPILKDKKVVLFLGRINWKKGLDILVQAYSILAKEKDNVHLMIVGNDEGGYIRKVKRWVREYGIEQRVTFTGILTGKEKLEAYAGSDIFVLPSYSENLGIAVLEAMICGLPVIISNQVGIHKEVSGAEAGIVIETNTKQLAEAIKNLLDNPHICKKMGENGKRLVDRTFRLDRVTDEMVELYEDILRKEL
jgi:glycosyltransferase involved in cell wall biosynthesis